MLPGPHAGGRPDGHEERGAEHEEGGDDEQPPHAPVLVGQGAQVDRGQVRRTEYGVEHLGHRQPEGPLHLALPGGAEAQGEREPDQVGQAEQDHREGLGGVPAHHHHDESGDDAQGDGGEEQRHHGGRRRAHGLLEAHQPGREGCPARDEERQHEDTGQPHQADDHGQRDVGPESDPRRVTQYVSEGVLGSVAASVTGEALGREGERVPGQEREDDQHHGPEGGDPARPARQFAASGDGPVAQGAEEPVGDGQRAGQGHRQREHREARLRPHEGTGVARQPHGTAHRHHDDGRDHAGEGTTGQPGRTGGPQAEGGRHQHGQGSGQHRHEGVAPAVRCACRAVPVVARPDVHAATLSSGPAPRPRGIGRSLRLRGARGRYTQWVRQGPDCPDTPHTGGRGSEAGPDLGEQSP